MQARNKHQTDASNVDLDARRREFGTAVKVARELAGLTQDELAIELHYSRPVIANLERGTFSQSAYRRAHEKFGRLPVISELEEKRDDGGGARQDPERDAVAEFELMLLDRTRERDTLLGTWHALWETEVNNETVFNSEVLELTGMRSRKRFMITNPRASLENPLGGYAWRAECRFIDGTSLLGVYASTQEENMSKGALQMKVHVGGRFIEGQWIGEGYDGDFARGHVVFCRDRSQLVTRMELLVGGQIRFKFHDEPGEEGKE